MPKVTVCKYCPEKIDQEKQEWIDVPGGSGDKAHLTCHQKNFKQEQSRKGRPSKVTEPGGPYR